MLFVFSKEPKTHYLFYLIQNMNKSYSKQLFY